MLIMQSHAEQLFHLMDTQHRQLGQVTVERAENQLLSGKFVPGLAFPAVEPLFRDFEEAVNAQALGVVDQLDRAIAALGLYLCSPDNSQQTPIHDVQIWSDGNITCRLGRRDSEAQNRSYELVPPHMTTITDRSHEPH
jgi:hypothetical protein